jgi:hypothetical protein
LNEANKGGDWFLGLRRAGKGLSIPPFFHLASLEEWKNSPPFSTGFRHAEKGRHPSSYRRQEHARP